MISDQEPTGASRQEEFLDAFQRGRCLVTASDGWRAIIALTCAIRSRVRGCDRK